MINQIGNLLIIYWSYLIVNLIKPSSGAYYELNRNPQLLVDNEDLIAGYGPTILSPQPFQAIGNLRNDDSGWEIEYPRIIQDPNWPLDEVRSKLGQVAGISGHKNNSIYIFHRGDNVWDHRSFDINRQYTSRDKGPIPNDTVIIVDGKTGKVIKSWGANKFYMPHGISLDQEGNVWLTDVALQQVFRFKSDDLEKPDLVLGQRFEPGSDWNHFCLPTDVVVASTGQVYISDGYCNSRILILSSDGKIEGEIGIKDNLMVPHNLVLLEEENLICVADRENRRILCYTAGLDRTEPGFLRFNINHPRFGRIFAVDHIGDLLFALSVPEDSSQSEGIIIDLATERIVNVWKPNSGFNLPHDLTVSSDRKSIFVTDIDLKGAKIYKFNVQ